MLVLWIPLIGGGVSLYAGNAGEFDIGLLTIFARYAPWAALGLVALVVPGLLLPERHASRMAALLLGLAVVLWIQGNVLVRDYGVIGLGELEWARHERAGRLDALLWLALPALAIAFHRRLVEHARTAAATLLALQLAQIGVATAPDPGIWTKRLPGPPPQVFDFSARRNVVHLILDGLQSTAFRALIEADPARAAAFDGFTFFEEATSPFPTTEMSLPAIFSGRLYDNRIPMRRFHQSVHAGPTIQRLLSENGYEVDLVKSVGFAHLGPHTHHYQLPLAYGVSRREHETANAVLMLQLTALRFAPHQAKRAVHEGRYGFDAALVALQLRPRWVAAHAAHRAFLQDLIARASATRSAPVYKFVHLTTTHWPPTLDAECREVTRRLPYTWANVRIQAACGLDQASALLAELRRLGVYDDALIIVQADHGFYHMRGSADHLEVANPGARLGGEVFVDDEHFAQIASPAAALLAIKPPGATGPLRRSRAQVELRDIPATLASLLELPAPFPGESVFGVPEHLTRLRSYQYYDRVPGPDDDFFERVDAFVIEGSVFDKAAWRVVGASWAPDASFEISRLDLASDAARRLFLRFGWDREGPRPGVSSPARALGSPASLYLSLPPGQPLELVASVAAPGLDAPQEIAVRVDGTTHGVWRVSPSPRDAPVWEEHRLVVPENAQRPAVSLVEFRFSRKAPSAEPGRPAPAAALFASFALRPAGR